MSRIKLSKALISVVFYPTYYKAWANLDNSVGALRLSLNYFATKYHVTAT